jgi:NADPH2:quinone reductase
MRRRCGGPGGGATKAIVVREPGGTEALTVRDIPIPEPGEGEALVELDAAGVNFIDVNQRSGAYPIRMPFIPGTEGAGVVRKVTPGVTEVSSGDRVAFATTPGAYAEFISVRAERLVRVPDGLPTEQAAAVMLQGMTAHYLINSICTFDDGDWCLIHAAAGGVGRLFVQLAKRRGLRVIGTASTADKADRALQAGADHVILYEEDDFVDAVYDLTSGKGVRAAYDGVGRDTFDDSLRCVSPRGYVVLFGQASGPVEPIDPRTLMQKGSLLFTRPGLANYIATREELLWRGEEVLALAEAGALLDHIHARYALERADEAHAAIESRATVGKVLLLP